MEKCVIQRYFNITTIPYFKLCREKQLFTSSITLGPYVDAAGQNCPFAVRVRLPLRGGPKYAHLPYVLTHKRKKKQLANETVAPACV